MTPTLVQCQIWDLGWKINHMGMRFVMFNVGQMGLIVIAGREMYKHL